MSVFFREFLCDQCAGGRKIVPPAIFLGVFGKYRGEAGHIAHRLDTLSLEMAHSCLYLQGIIELIQGREGPWASLPAGEKVELDHVFLWRRGEQAMVGRLWGSADAVVREVPLCACLHGIGPSMAWLLTRGVAELETLKQELVGSAPKTETAPTTVQERLQRQLDQALSSTLERLRSALAVDSGQVPGAQSSPMSRRQNFVADPGFGQNSAGLLRVLNLFQDRMSAYAPEASRRKGEAWPTQSLRLPAASAAAAESVWLWHDLLQPQFHAAAPVLYLQPMAGGWLDLVAGEPGPKELFCLRANAKRERLSVESDGAPLPSGTASPLLESALAAYLSGTAVPSVLGGIPAGRSPAATPTEKGAGWGERVRGLFGPRKSDAETSGPTSTPAAAAVSPLSAPPEVSNDKPQTPDPPFSAAKTDGMAAPPPPPRTQATLRQAPTLLVLALAGLAFALVVLALLVPSRFTLQPEPTVTRVLSGLHFAQQPADERAPAGSRLTLAAKAGARGIVEYQWYFNGRVMPGSRGPLLPLPPLSASFTGSYFVVAACGPEMVTSRVATLTITPVVPPPVLALSPTDQEAEIGAVAVLSARVESAVPLRLQWFHEHAPVPGATQAQWRIGPLGAVDWGSYRLIASNAGGSVTSHWAAVRPPPAVAPRLARQPQPATVALGEPVELSAAVEGTLPLHLQWMRNGQPVRGAATAAFTLASASTNDAGVYCLVASNRAGAITTALARLTILQPVRRPEFRVQPGDHDLVQGESAALRAAADGTTPITYRWFRNGEMVAQETNGMLSLPGFDTHQIGRYHVVASNSGGLATSLTFLISLRLPPKPAVLAGTAPAVPVVTSAPPVPAVAAAPTLPAATVASPVPPSPSGVLSPRLTNSIGMEFVLVAPGSTETSSTAFYFGVFEVTRDQFSRVVSEGVVGMAYDRGNVPARMIYRGSQAMDFCGKLTRLERSAPDAPSEIGHLIEKGWRYSLPTETQWKTMARQANPAKSATPRNVAFGRRNTPVPVEELRTIEDPAEGGVYGLWGNVSEWCLVDGEEDRFVLKGGCVQDLAVETGYADKLQPGPLHPEGRGDEATVDPRFRGFRCILQPQKSTGTPP